MQGTSFSISNPAYENVVLRQSNSVMENKENRIGNIANHNYVHSDEQGSLDSTESKPKQAKLLAENQRNSAQPGIESTLDNSSPTPNANSARSKSQDPISNSPSLKYIHKASQPSPGSDKGVLFKSQSFPQHSAPPKKRKSFYWPCY